MTAPPTRGRPPPAWLYYPLLITQGLWVSRRTPRLPPAPGPVTGTFGTGSELRLLALGDSIVAGVGVEWTDQALPAVLARRLSAGTGQRVTWRAVGRNGARSKQLPGLLDAAADGFGGEPPDLVVLSNGINDVASALSVRQVLEGLQAGVAGLESRFPRAYVFQLGIPPLHAFPALPNPLRQVLGRRAALVDERLRAWLACRPRSRHLGFSAPPRPEQFARDGYHPGPEGVEAWAEALLAGMLAALAGSEAPAAEAAPPDGS